MIELQEENLTRLGPDWRHPLVLGHGMDAKVLEEAGIEDADVLIAATDGDNTNLVIAQVATERYHVAARGGADPGPGAGEGLRRPRLPGHLPGEDGHRGAPRAGR